MDETVLTEEIVLTEEMDRLIRKQLHSARLRQETSGFDIYIPATVKDDKITALTGCSYKLPAGMHAEQLLGIVVPVVKLIENEKPSVVSYGVITNVIKNGSIISMRGPGFTMSVDYNPETGDTALNAWEGGEGGGIIGGFRLNEDGTLYLG